VILTQIDVSGVRNIQSISFQPDPLFNLITGPNGAGKTSVLEAIHLLSTGHSFRTRKTKEILNHTESELSVIARIHDSKLDNDLRAAIQKNRVGETQLKLNFESLNSMAEMTRILPVKALFPDSHKLIQEGPSARRQFLDWGLFHVEQSFFNYWKAYKQALEQRNHALRRQLADAEIKAWDSELAKTGQAISEARARYVIELRGWLVEYAARFHLDGEISIDYKQGWNEAQSLADTLASSFSQCQRFKTTTVGPHRAELAIGFNKVPAKQVMSRGQQKLLIYAMHFAQIAMFEDAQKQRPIVLCDDLAAELDEEHRNRMLECLTEMNLQTFITSNMRFDFPDNMSFTVFHVEHGELQEVV